MSLDIKTVERKRIDLDKAVKEEAPSPLIISLLAELQKGVIPSDKLLRDTKIGVVVNRLKQHKDPAVAKIAAGMVARWKQEMQKQKFSSSGSSTPKPAGNGVHASPAPGVVSASPTSVVKLEKTKAYAGDVSKRNSKADGMDDKIKITGEPVRDSCLKLMYDGLAYMSEEPPQEILHVAIEVETAAYGKYTGITDSYKGKIRSLFQNLKNKGNPQLRKRVFSGEISARRFVDMTHDELKSEERKAEDQKLMKENMDKAMVAQEERSVSSALRCGKCGQKRVSYTQAQTRSADEPMTTFCECLHCGNRWKFS